MPIAEIAFILPLVWNFVKISSFAMPKMMGEEGYETAHGT